MAEDSEEDDESIVLSRVVLAYVELKFVLVASTPVLVTSAPVLVAKVVEVAVVTSFDCEASGLFSLLVFGWALAFFLWFLGFFFSNNFARFSAFCCFRIARRSAFKAFNLFLFLNLASFGVSPFGRGII